ncbi:hypothetical protein CR513_14885, partial [Mucuna pruriens]
MEEIRKRAEKHIEVEEDQADSLEAERQFDPLERGSKAPGPVPAKGLSPELHPLEREVSTNTA